MSSKIVHVQTILFEDELVALKVKTGKSTTKDALAKAVEYYLEERK